MYERDPVQETTGATVGFHTVIDAAVHADVPRIVYASTSAVYEGNEVPYRETMGLRPPDLKAFAKKMNEELGELYSARYGIETLALRPFSVYGVDEESKGPYANVASLFTWAMASGLRPLLWGTGRQTRDFIFTEDVARAVVLALESNCVGALNVGTGVETSFDQLITELNKLLGTDLEPQHMAVPISIYASRLLADTTQATQGLGFTARTALADGLTRILEHLESLDPVARRSLGTLQETFRHGVTAETLAAHKSRDGLRAA
jgi:UDP-glucose 4-epimerase